MNIDKEFIGFRIQLYPNEEQIQVLNKYFGACRYAYNWAIDREIEDFEYVFNLFREHTPHGKEDFVIE